MFILHSERDNSYCKVDDGAVVFDKDSPPKEGEHLIFFFDGREESGRVIMKSNSVKQINTRFEQIKKNLKKKPRPRSLAESDDESPVPTKISRKVPKSRQIEKREVKDNQNKKKGDKLIQKLIRKEIPDKIVIPKNEALRSPSKDELKKKLAELQKEMELSQKSTATKQKNYISTSTSHTTESTKINNIKDDSATESDSGDDGDESLLKALEDESSDGRESSDQSLSDVWKISADVDYEEKYKDSHNNSTIIEKNQEDPIIEDPIIEDPIDYVNDPDLYGKDWPGEKMVKLISKVYCKETEYKLSRSMCSQASHVVRRLITGVFKPSGYLQATYSGQAPRAHLRHGKPAPVKALNYIAKNEIIDYAMALAKAKEWVTCKGVPQSRDYLQRAMTQKIGELKRTYEQDSSL